MGMVVFPAYSNLFLVFLGSFFKKNESNQIIRKNCLFYPSNPYAFEVYNFCPKAGLFLDFLGYSNYFIIAFYKK
jgi:hypothetical protein